MDAQERFYLENGYYNDYQAGGTYALDIEKPVGKYFNVFTVPTGRYILGTNSKDGYQLHGYLLHDEYGNEPGIFCSSTSGRDPVTHAPIDSGNCKKAGFTHGGKIQ